jgi:hypothetical protein
MNTIKLLVGVCVVGALVCSSVSPSLSSAQDPAFIDVTNSAGMADTSDGSAAAWGDYDGDGDLDLFVANDSSGLGASLQDFLYRNNGAGRFARVDVMAGLSDNAGGSSAAWGDFDNDGHLDLAVGSFPSVLLYRNNGAGGFTPVSAMLGPDLNGNSAAWGDYDNDNDLDLFVARSGQDALLRNDRQAGFVRVDVALGIVDSFTGAAAAWGDYDNDGDLDLYVANGFGQEQDFLYRNDVSRGGGFVRVDVQLGLVDSSSGRGVAWGDYDGDGDLDLFVANDRQPPQDFLYRNDVPAGGGFVRVDTMMGLSDSSSGREPAWADYDNDGDLDLCVAEAGFTALYRNEGAQGFMAAVSGFGGGSSQGAAWADYDNDGDLDLFIPNFGRERDSLYRNVSGRRNYLIVRALTDSDGNATDATMSDDRDAIGARVEVDLDGVFSTPPQLLREISGGQGSQSQLAAHFGLGSIRNVAVRVRFPDGTIVVEKVAANQRIVIRDR